MKLKGVTTIFTYVFTSIFLFITIFLLTSCGGRLKNEPEPTPTPSVTKSITHTQPAPAPTPTHTPLVIASGGFNARFCPFTAQSAYDRTVADMTQIGTMLVDRAGMIVWNGIEGETRSYNGTEHIYTGTANLSQRYDSETDITTYRIQIRDDLFFSDGVPATIDDVIFGMYVLLDPSYVGSSTLYTYDIVGLRAYRSQVSDGDVSVYTPTVNAMIAAGSGHEWHEDDAWTKDIQRNYWVSLREDWLEGLRYIVYACNTYYIEHLEMLGFPYSPEEIAVSEGLQTAWGMTGWGFGSVNENGIFTSSDLRKNWDFNANEYPALKDFYYEAKARYGDDFESFWHSLAPEGADMDLSDNAKNTALKDLAAINGAGVPNITGIRRINDYEMEILLHGYSAPAVYAVLSQYIVPKHYYGDIDLWDYAHNRFGFPFGDISIIRSKETRPMGAGAYAFVGFENKTVYMEANPLYFRAQPKTKYIQFKEAPSAEYATGIVSGTHDAGNLTGNTITRDYIKKANTDTGELTGNVFTTTMVDNRGYGYVGINAFNVSVNNERGSDASKNLRKALATVFAVFRDLANNSYYGEMAATIQYPISNTSWAAPRPTDEGYEIAFSKDINGKDIYTTGMNLAEKTEAALTAALGFFEAAGFVVEEGKIVAGPAPARPTRRGEMSYLEYEVYVPGDGVGDHPSFALITDTANALAKIGITLSIKDLSDDRSMWTALDAEIADIWTAAWQATADPDMHQVYHGHNIVGVPGSSESNKYSINDPELNTLIMAGRISDDQPYRRAIYKQAMDIVLDWAVEIPNYQRKDFEVFSTQRVDTDTLTKENTTNWGWMREVHLVEMRR